MLNHTQLSSEDSYGHELHLKAFLGGSTDPEAKTQMLHSAIDAARVVGLSADSTLALLKTPGELGMCQLLALENGLPTSLVSAYPFVQSPHRYAVTLERVLQHHAGHEALYECRLNHSTRLYAHDPEYVLHEHSLTKHVEIELSALAHEVHFSDPELSLSLSHDPKERLEFVEQLRRTMLQSSHSSVADELDALTKSTEELPLEVRLGELCAYLHSGINGQQDEAWCRGQVIGKQKVTILLNSFELLDVVVLREENTQPVVVRIAAHEKIVPNSLKVGDYLTANVWMQVKLCATSV